GAIQMGIPYVLFARGLRQIGAPEASLLALLEPALNPILVFLFHGEQPTAPTIVGGVFLLAGVACRYWPARMRLHQKPVAASLAKDEQSPVPSPPGRGLG